MTQRSKKPTADKVPGKSRSANLTGGSRKGRPNKTTSVLKEAILQAAEAVGADGKGKEGIIGYLKTVARKDVKAFSALLGKVLPLQVTGEGGGPIQSQTTLNMQGLTVDQLKAIASIPVDAG